MSAYCLLLLHMGPDVVRHKVNHISKCERTPSSAFHTRIDYTLNPVFTKLFEILCFFLGQCVFCAVTGTFFSDPQPVLVCGMAGKLVSFDSNFIKLCLLNRALDFFDFCMLTVCQWNATDFNNFK